MAAIVGKYEYTSSENMIEYLKSIGVSDEMLEKIGKAAKQPLEIQIDGKTVTLIGLRTTTFECGKEIDEQMPGDNVLKSTLTIDGDKIVIKSTDSKDRKGARVFEKTADGIVVTCSSEVSSVTGKRFYKKA